MWLLLKDMGKVEFLQNMAIWIEMSVSWYTQCPYCFESCTGCQLASGYNLKHCLSPLRPCMAPNFGMTTFCCIHPILLVLAQRVCYGSCQLKNLDFQDPEEEPCVVVPALWNILLFRVRSAPILLSFQGNLKT